MKTIEKPIYHSIPIGETRTLYVANDDTEWGTYDDANARNKVLTCREILKNWTTVEIMEDQYYLVRDNTKYTELLEVTKSLMRSICQSKPNEDQYPCVVRFEYGGGYEDSLVLITKEDVRRLNTLLEEE